MSIQKKILILFFAGLLLPVVGLIIFVGIMLNDSYSNYQSRIFDNHYKLIMDSIREDDSLPVADAVYKYYQQLDGSSTTPVRLLKDSFIAKVNESGHIVKFFGGGTSPEVKRLQADFSQFLTDHKKHISLAMKSKGFAVIDNKIWQLSTCPVPNEPGHSIYMGKPLSMIINKYPYLSNASKDKSFFFELSPLSSRSEIPAGIKCSNGQKISCMYKDQSCKMAYFSTIDNIFGEPSMQLKMTSAPGISTIFCNNIWFMMICISAGAAVVLILIYIFLKKTIIKPVDMACGIAAESLKELATCDSDRDLELDVHYKRGHLCELLELTRKATELYKRSSETASTLFRNVPFGIIVYDSEFNIKQINGPAQELLGYKEDKLIGHKCNEVFCPAGCLSCPVKKHGGVKNVEMVFLRSDGSPLPVLITGTTLHLDGEDMILEGFVDLSEQDRNRTLMKNYKAQLEKTVTKLQEQNQNLQDEIKKREDISKELKRAKEKAEGDDKLKSVFLANMSHELRTPLNTIVGFANLLSGNVSDSERKNYAEVINNSSETLMTLISDIIDMSKLETGKIEINYEMVDISTELFNLEEIYKTKLQGVGKSEIKLIAKCDKSSPVIKTDAVRFRQIFGNLLDNAIKFTDKGEIEFGLEDINDEYATFYVRDTGCGIPDDSLDKIFERFITVGEKQAQGAGLGLAICAGLIEAMKGRINVDSVPGNGSVFRFELPINQKQG